MTKNIIYCGKGNYATVVIREGILGWFVHLNRMTEDRIIGVIERTAESRRRKASLEKHGLIVCGAWVIRYCRGRYTE